jgi:hypothetical protein
MTGLGAILTRMPLPSEKRDIPRVWEVDWALPAAEGGTRWAAYDWLLDTAQELGASEVSIVGANYEVLGRLDSAIGSAEASYLRTTGHNYRVDGITVSGVSRRGGWWVRGPVLVAWANDAVLAEVEGQRPAAVAAVATWPEDVAGWRSVYAPERIGQVRTEQEAEFDTVIGDLDPRVARAIDSAAAWVNENHSVLSTHEREAMAGMFVALRSARIPVDLDAVRARLMAAGWNGGLIERVLQLGERVERGETPRHRPFRLDLG